MAIRTGDLVRAREATWRVTGLRSYARVQVVRLLGMEEVNRARDCTLFTPFDEVERIGEGWRPRVVSRRRWMRALGDLLVEAQPRDVPLSVVSADVALQAYQLDPLLTLLRGEASRVLVADEVGLGKTVQAGLVVRELRARGQAERVLILVPAGLREQWHDELRDRVGLVAHVVDADWQAAVARELPVNVNPWSLPGVHLASLDYIKQGDVLRGAARVRWDVVVVDEAHALAGGSERASAAGRLAGRARFVLLLTGTPHSGSAVDFDTLRRIGALEPARAGPIDVRGSPECRDPAAGAVALQALADAPRDPLVIFRRSRLAAARGGGRRRVHLLRVRLTADERRMHDLLRRYVRRVERSTGVGHAARLAMVVLRKRACSSAWSFARSVQRRWQLIAERLALPEQRALPFWPLAREAVDAEGEDEEPGGVLGEAGLPLRHERAWLAVLAEVARRASRAESKIRAINRLLRRTASAGEAVVIFTEYRDTLAHLAERLDRSVSVALLHGGLAVGSRQAALARFAAGEARVLLTTDAAGEGLNLQRRCRVVIQVELPWNPTRVEQRIGRVDRLGQSRTVHAWQFVAGDTYEQRVQGALRERLVRIAAAIGSESGVRVRRGVSDEARVAGDRLRLLRAVARGGERRDARRDGSIAMSGRHAVERRCPWVAMVRLRGRGPLRGFQPGLLCFWRVRIRAPDGVLIETRVVPLHVPVKPSVHVARVLAQCRGAMERVLEGEVRRACRSVWERERPWRERWRQRVSAIDAREIVDSIEAQPLLFPDLAEMEMAWRREERSRLPTLPTPTRDARDEEGEELNAEQELLLVLMVSTSR